MVKVKGLTIRYPESTVLALASAAFTLMGIARWKKNKRKAQRLHDLWRKFMDELGGVDTSTRRAAIETLRSDPEARTEALRAIELQYPREEATGCWIVSGFRSDDGPFIEPVDLNHPERRVFQGSG